MGRIAALGLIVALLAPFGAGAHKVNPEVIEDLTGYAVDTNDHPHEEAPADADPRNEARTLATFPEWYIVYNAEEYGDYVGGGGMPSGFPYFGSIEQYWDVIDTLDAAVGFDTIDEESRTVLSVIGISFSVEYSLIGAYEGTVGRLAETSNAFIKSPEDHYTDAVAKEYGAFLLQQPWYDFPYLEKLGGLWSTYDVGSLTFRGIERRLAFTVGYGFKALYAYAMGAAAESSFGYVRYTTEFGLADASVAALQSIEGIESIEAHDDGHITASLPRYRAFLAPALEILSTGARFVDIEGNTHILVSAVGSGDETLCLPEESTTIIFSLPLLSEAGAESPNERIAVLVPVSELATIVDALPKCGYRIEHLYDY